MNSSPITSATTMIGSIITNRWCQVPWARMAPEIVGPSAGAAEITTPTRPITRPRERSGTSARTVVISSGSTIAVPAAWITRAPSSTGKLGAMTASAVPARNSAIARRNTERTDRRVMRKPVVGMTTAMVSMKPVESHCAVTAVIDRSSISTGSATESSVSLRIMTKAETTSTAMIGVTRVVAAGSGAEVEGPASTAGSSPVGVGEGACMAGALSSSAVRRAGTGRPPVGGAADEVRARIDRPMRPCFSSP